MARPLRIEYPDAYYHVMNRGAGRKCIFRGKAFYHLFLQLLEEINELYGIEIHAYCLMGNHYHLLIKTPRANLSKAMQHLSSVYTMRHNKLLNRDGPLFRGRFKSILVEAENYLLHVSRYIHLNPVEAKIVKHAEEYPWSSFNGYCYPQTRPKWLICDDILERFNVKNAIDCYKGFMNEGIDNKIRKIYSSTKIVPILGKESFCDAIRYKFKIKPEQEIPQSKYLATQILSVNKIVNIIANHYRCQAMEIFSGENKRLKKIAIYYCNRLAHITQAEIGKHFIHISYSAVSRICTQMKCELEMDVQLNMELRDLEIILSNIKI